MVTLNNTISSNEVEVTFGKYVAQNNGYVPHSTNNPWTYKCLLNINTNLHFAEMQKGKIHVSVHKISNGVFCIPKYNDSNITSYLSVVYRK